MLGIGEDRLSIYLNDHLAGATGGASLARQIARHSAAFDALADEISQDRETLLEIMRRLGVREDHLKIAIGWVGERAAWLKFAGELGDSPVNRLEEIEALALGVEGKLAMWRALRQTHGTDRRLDSIDLDTLIARGEDQRRRIEHERTRAAAEAFA